MIFFFLCLFSFHLFANAPFFEERLKSAEPGDYWVVAGGKMVTLLSIQSIEKNSIIFEEISIPEEKGKMLSLSWPDWIKKKAPEHSSWSMFEVDRTSGEIIECYSFSRGAWLQLSPRESLIATLMQLPLMQVPKVDLRRIGPPPLAGEVDHRKIWQPPAIFEGKKTSFLFDAYQTFWPKDGTELAGQKLLLYFDKDIQFPFPFWIQIETTHAQFSLRTLDARKHLLSPHKSLPRRIPEWVGQPLKNEDGLRLALKSPKYYREFELFAIDVTKKEREILPIDFSLIQKEGDLLLLQIEEEILKNSLTPGHHYTWLLIPTGHGESFIQSKKPYTFDVDSKEKIR